MQSPLLKPFEEDWLTFLRSPQPHLTSKTLLCWNAVGGGMSEHKRGRMTGSFLHGQDKHEEHRSGLTSPQTPCRACHAQGAQMGQPQVLANAWYPSLVSQTGHERAPVHFQKRPSLGNKLQWPPHFQTKGHRWEPGRGVQIPHQRR